MKHEINIHYHPKSGDGRHCRRDGGHVSISQRIFVHPDVEVDFNVNVSTNHREVAREDLERIAQALMAATDGVFTEKAVV